MKSKMMAVCGVLLLILSAALLGADKPALAGKWTIKDGNADIKIDFKVDGDKVTGTFNNPLAGGPMDIKEGKLKEDKVSFYIVRKFTGAEIRLKWTGTISGDEIQFKRESVFVGSGDSSPLRPPSGGFSNFGVFGGDGPGPGMMMGGGSDAKADLVARRDKTDKK
jgi:hypothetical protein